MLPVLQFFSRENMHNRRLKHAAAASLMLCGLSFAATNARSKLWTQVFLAATALLAAAALALAVAVILVAHGAGTACFFRCELVGVARSVRSLAALGGDFALLLRIHRCEATVAGITALVVTFVATLVVCHDCLR